MNASHRRVLFAACIGAVLIAASACAPGNARFAGDAPAGFFWGLWHGSISLFTLVVGLWDDSVHVYEVHNTGGWYNFGFLLGVGAAWGGGGRGGRHTWRWTRRVVVTDSTRDDAPRSAP